VAAYSPRPGTFAYRNQPDDVAAEVKRERLQAVEAVHAASAGRINARLLGREVEVLVEREVEGRLTGRARGGQLVHFDGHRTLVGKLVSVRIDEATPWSLQGQQADAIPLTLV